MFQFTEFLFVFRTAINSLHDLYYSFEFELILLQNTGSVKFLYALLYRPLVSTKYFYFVILRLIIRIKRLELFLSAWKAKSLPVNLYTFTITTASARFLTVPSLLHYYGLWPLLNYRHINLLLRPPAVS